MHHLRHDRPSISTPYAQKCTHGHMYNVLDTFRRTKSPTRLSCRWSRLVRQLSDAPPQARSSVNLPSIRAKMFPRTHVPCARHLPPDQIGRSAKWRLSRIVRQLSDAPPQARSTVHLHSIRTKMFPWTHVPCARHLHPCRIARSAKLQVEPTCTTTL